MDILTDGMIQWYYNLLPYGGVMTMAYNKDAQERYRRKSIQLACIYRPGTDIEDGKRVRQYLADTGQSANSYIKSLIKADLDNKGVPYPDTCETDTSEV